MLKPAGSRGLSVPAEETSVVLMRRWTSLYLLSFDVECKTAVIAGNVAKIYQDLNPRVRYLIAG
jgi:hypothetical protein